MKKYLGIVIIIYTIIITYLIISNKISHFLAPFMYTYLYIIFIPLLITGISLLLKNNYKFKISDLILLLPLILLFLTNDGVLPASLSNNKTIGINKKNNYIQENITKDNHLSKELQEIIKDKSQNFDKVDFDFKDEVYASLSNYLTYEPKAVKFIGSTVKITGFVNDQFEYLPKGYFQIGKYSISCCAADASYIGLIAKKENFKIKNKSWYQLEGVLLPGKDSQGYKILYLKIINYKEIKDKSQKKYIYPCYYYKDGSCNDLNQYNLEY